MDAPVTLLPFARIAIVGGQWVIRGSLTVADHRDGVAGFEVAHIAAGLLDDADELVPIGPGWNGASPR